MADSTKSDQIAVVLCTQNFELFLGFDFTSNLNDVKVKYFDIGNEDTFKRVFSCWVWSLVLSIGLD